MFFTETRKILSSFFALRGQCFRSLISLVWFFKSSLELDPEICSETSFSTKRFYREFVFLQLINCLKTENCSLLAAKGQTINKNIAVSFVQRVLIVNCRRAHGLSHYDQ